MAVEAKLEPSQMAGMHKTAKQSTPRKARVAVALASCLCRKRASQKLCRYLQPKKREAINETGHKTRDRPRDKVHCKPKFQSTSLREKQMASLQPHMNGKVLSEEQATRCCIHASPRHHKVRCCTTDMAGHGASPWSRRSTVGLARDPFAHSQSGGRR